MNDPNYSRPDSLKKLRACINCHLVKTEEQFIKDGCENCKNKQSETMSNLTQHFKGVIAITNPRYSWCAKWIHKRNI